MHLLHNEYTGGLKLGASTTIAQYVLPPLLASFIGKFPQVSLSLLNGNSREIEAALQEHRIDLGFVEGVFRLPNIRYTTFLEDELVAVVRTGSKLAVGEEITPDELFHLPLVLRERGSGTLDVFEGMPMLRDFSFAQPQGQESGLAQVFMQFAMHNNHKL